MKIPEKCQKIIKGLTLKVVARESGICYQTLSSRLSKEEAGRLEDSQIVEGSIRAMESHIQESRQQLEELKAWQAEIQEAV